jgi:D-arabinose 1-dehydrogenase-like Zn-dependent alcohol dehydrogenase
MQPGDGSMRERAAVPPHDVVALPPGADPVLVGALGLSAVGAWMAVTWRGELAPEEQLLVLGASGVVGQAGVQSRFGLGGAAGDLGVDPFLGMQRRAGEHERVENVR